MKKIIITESQLRNLVRGYSPKKTIRLTEDQLKRVIDSTINENKRH